MAIFKKQSLKTGNTTRTKASELTLRQSIYPLCLVTILFFLWGFSYGLLDTLNKHFQNTLGITKARSSGLQAAYFGAYPLASLGHANWLLRHYGYKIVFIWGLCLYGIGALVAWPCILHRSFGGFCAAIFIIGNGLGSLETAANPYITVCGPPRYSEMRINLSQAFNGIGTVIAPVLGSYVFFKDTGDSTDSLKNVQWVYLAIACFVFALSVVFYFSPIPEITDADMEFQAEETHAGSSDQSFWKQYRLFHAAFAQFCYTGAQVAIASYFINYAVEAGRSDSVAAQLLAGAQGSFAIGRFAGVALMRFIRPRWVFLVYLSMCIVFISPAVGLEHGNAGIAMLYITLFFESICFPTIVALGMRGLGRHSKRGSGWIVGGVCGGAVVPPALGGAADSSTTARAMSVPLAFFVLAWTYCFSVNFIPAYREPADRLGTAEIGLKNAAPVKDVESGSNGGSGNEADTLEGEVEKDKGVVVHQDKEAETAEIQEVKN
ncbi:L-fucose-proton symporter [Pseudocercospora fuligena]|uniref:L-fucose-proton symporter n=1 Tax=Pseudocercospora fuligena TaxID=685502 RepID=A0A8H6RSM1_9PEZI|nr:L-fucose-proton symporter [Pseudocercospora fuligena]